MVSGCSLQRTVLMTAAFVFVGGIFDVGCQEQTESADSPNIAVGVSASVSGSSGSSAESCGLRQDVLSLRTDILTFTNQLAQSSPCTPGSGKDNRPAGASVYIRWGNGKCPENAQLIYSGHIGGAFWRYSGGAANHLCLHKDPQFTTELPFPKSGHAPVFGMEYETGDHASSNRDALCSACHIPRPTTIMMPATQQCPEKWTLEYSGYLMAGKPDQGRVSMEYLCLDSQLQGRAQTTVNNDNQGSLYPAQTYCGLLPCPPFVKGKILPCVVCSQ